MESLQEYWITAPPPVPKKEKVEVLDGQMRFFVNGRPVVDGGGPWGPQGEIGPVGPPGNPGPQGVTGWMGVQGVTGTQGFQGPLHTHTAGWDPAAELLRTWSGTRQVDTRAADQYRAQYAGMQQSIDAMRASIGPSGNPDVFTHVPADFIPYPIPGPGFFKRVWRAYLRFLVRLGSFSFHI